MEKGFKLKATCFDAMINYHLSQKLKLLRNNEFNQYSNSSQLLFFIIRAVFLRKRLIRGPNPSRSSIGN